MSETKEKCFNLKIRRNSKRAKGITLVALVVTIVVLLILAGITITYVLGENSVFHQASEAKLKTEIGRIEEAANLIYSDLNIQKHTGGRKDVTLTDIVNEMKKDKSFEIETRKVSENAITGIEVSPKELRLIENGTGKITVKYLGAEDGYVYYAKIDGKFYQMRLTKGGVVVDREEKNPEGTAVTATLQVEYDKSSNIVASTTINENEITVTGGTGTGAITLNISYGEHKDTCSVKISPKVTSISAEPLTIEERKEGQVVAKLNPSDAVVSLSYSTTDTSKIKVDATTGKVKANPITSVNATEQATVTITDSITGKTGTCAITIKAVESDWEEIAEIAKAITEGNAKGKDGETVTKDSNSEEARVEGKDPIKVGGIYKVKYNGVMKRVRVLGFMHDHLPDADGYNDNDARAGISFEFIDFMGSTRQINAARTFATGWGGCSMRTYLSGEIESTRFSEAFKKSVKEVVKPYLLGNGSTTLKTDCKDKLWLLSGSEIWRDSVDGQQYRLYAKNVGSFTPGAGYGFACKPVGGANENWWLRSPDYRNGSNLWMAIGDGGVCLGATADSYFYVFPGFSI